MQNSYKERILYPQQKYAFFKLPYIKIIILLFNDSLINSHIISGQIAGFRIIILTWIGQIGGVAMICTTANDNIGKVLVCIRRYGNGSVYNYYGVVKENLGYYSSVCGVNIRI